MLSDASLVSGDSNAPAGGPAVVLRRHHHLRSVTSPQAPSPPLSKCQTPLSPLRPPLQVAGGPAGTSRYFCSTPVVILDLLLFFSSGHLLIISFSPMVFPALSTCCFQQTLIFTPPFLRLHANCICQRGQMLTHEFR